jgi:hypothetical protein
MAKKSRAAPITMRLAGNKIAGAISSINKILKL